MGMSLREWVKEECDQYGSDAILSDAFIDETLRKHRLLEPERIAAAINSNDTEIQVDSSSRRVAIPLTDLQGTRQFYGHSYIYHLHPVGLEVLVNEAPVASYEFFPRSLSLDFLAPRPEAEPVVVIRGHIVDMAAVMVECLYSLASRISTLANVKDREFSRVANRIRESANVTWRPRIIRRVGK
jgi:hypothetical protein